MRCRACKGDTLAIHPNDPDRCGCDPEYEPRLNLEPHGYEFHPSYDNDGGEWSAVISAKTRVARRDHKSGNIVKGDRYREVVTRYIDDESNRSRLNRWIKKLQ